MFARQGGIYLFRGFWNTRLKDSGSAAMMCE
jgi:hypothetical protein